MPKIYEIDRKDISNRTRKLIKSVQKTSTTDDKVNAGLALSILALVSTETDSSVAQQLLSLLKTIQKS